MVTSLQGHSWEGCMQNNKHDKNHTFHSFYQAPSWSSFSLWLCSALWASSLSAVSVHTHTHTVHTLTALSGFMTSALCTHPLSSPHPLWWCWGVALAAPAHLSFLPRLAPWSHECASTPGSLHGRLVAWPLHRHWDRDTETNLQHNVHKFGNGGTVPTQADWTVLANASKWCLIIIFLSLSLSLQRVNNKVIMYNYYVVMKGPGSIALAAMQAK